MRRRTIPRGPKAAAVDLAQEAPPRRLPGRAGLKLRLEDEPHVRRVWLQLPQLRQLDGVLYAARWPLEKRGLA